MKGLKAYQSASVEAAVNVAEPYKITSMLFNALLNNMSLAKSAHLSKNWEVKSEAISKAQAITSTLAGTLKDEAAPEISENLRALYGYVLDSLSDYMLTGEEEKIEGSIKVVREIKSAWDEIGNKNEG